MQKRTLALTLLFWSILMLSMASSLSYATSGQTLQKFDYQTAHFEEGLVAYGSAWYGQQFTASASYYLTNITLKCIKLGSSWTKLTIGVGQYDSTLNKTNILTTQDIPISSIIGDWSDQNFTFSTPAKLSKDWKYIVFWYCDGTNDTNGFGFKVSTSDAYTSGSLVKSENGGQTWTIYGNDAYFIFYGYAWENPADIFLQWMPMIVLIMMLGIAFGMLEEMMKKA